MFHLNNKKNESKERKESKEHKEKKVKDKKKKIEKEPDCIHNLYMDGGIQKCKNCIRKLIFYLTL
jgi:hypothetical protein